MITVFSELLANGLNLKTLRYLCFVTTGARATVIEEFNKRSDYSPSIMLLSLTAGGVGLNLTAASRVFLLDPVRSHCFFIFVISSIFERFYDN